MKECIEISVLEASDVQAQLRLRYVGEPPAGAELSGTVTGPYCSRTRTLPATIELHSIPGAGELQCEALVPDPCFWSADLPFLYQISLELRRGREVVDSAEFPFALHPKRAVKQ